MCGCDEPIITIQQGDDEILPITLTDTAEDGTVTPVNLTGATLYLAIRRDGEEALVVDLSQASHTDAANGESSITIPRDTTKDLVPDAPHTGVLLMQDADDNVTTQAKFRVVVVEAVKIIA